jgi:hypothetical protein
MGRAGSLLDFKQKTLRNLSRIGNTQLDINVTGQWLRDEGTLTHEEG